MSHPRRLLVIAAGLAAVTVVATRAADPEWVRRTGLDVWNYRKLTTELGESEAEAKRMDVELADTGCRFEANRSIARDVGDGRRPLRVAAAVWWQTNQDTRGYTIVLDRRFRGRTPEARAAGQILYWIELDESLPARQKAAALARLKAEYAAAFEPPVRRDAPPRSQPKLPAAKPLRSTRM